MRVKTQKFVRNTWNNI